MLMLVFASNIKINVNVFFLFLFLITFDKISFKIVFPLKFENKDVFYTESIFSIIVHTHLVLSIKFKLTQDI